MQFIINAPNNVIDNFCVRDNYKEIVNKKPNPESKEDYFKRRVQEYINSTAVEGAAKQREVQEKVLRAADEVNLKVSVEDV